MTLGKRDESGPGVQQDGSPTVTLHDPYASLRSRDYRRFAIGWLVANTGLQMQAVAVGWELYERTHSAMALGLVGLAQALPVVALTLPGGHAADVFDRRWVVVFSQVVFALAAAGLVLVSAASGPVWAMYVLLVAAGSARAFNGPARAALMRVIVETEVFENAVAWNSGAFQIAAIGGPALGGVLISVTGAAWPAYACTAVACLFFAVTIVGVKPLVTERRPVGMSLWNMWAGMSYVWREKSIMAAITLDLFAVLLGSATSLLPIYAEDILKVGPTGLGLLKAAPFVGALLMALVLAHRPPFQHAGQSFLWAVAGFGAGMIVFGLSRSFALSLCVLALAGALDAISVVIRHTLVQIRTPDEVRGRVSGVNTVFIECSNELGGFESGLVAQLFGPVISVVSGGIGTILVVMGIAGVWPEIRRLKRL
jgi:MFS family permease